MRENGIDQPPTEQSAVDLEDFDPDAAIIEPTLNGYIGGVVEIKGNARGGPYRLEYGRGVEPTRVDADRPGARQRGRPTACWRRWIRPGWRKGLYTLRLTVNRGDGPRVWTTPVTIDNTPPTAVISEPKPDQLYVMEDDEQININVLPNDTWAVDRVEFSDRFDRYCHAHGCALQRAVAHHHEAM